MLRIGHPSKAKAKLRWVPTTSLDDLVATKVEHDMASPPSRKRCATPGMRYRSSAGTISDRDPHPARSFSGIDPGLVGGQLRAPRRGLGVVPGVGLGGVPTAV